MLNRERESQILSQILLAGVLLTDNYFQSCYIRPTMFHIINLTVKKKNLTQSESRARFENKSRARDRSKRSSLLQNFKARQSLPGGPVVCTLSIL
jgi:hypothetical protein